MDQNSLVIKTKELLRKYSVLTLKYWKQLTIFFLIILLINLLLIQFDIRDIQYSVEEKPILKTYRVEGQAFYQKSEFKKWFILSGEEFLSAGTHVQTYTDASAVLLFVEGSSRIEISENTQFSISETQKEILLDFKEGEIFVHAENSFENKKVILKVGSRFFNLGHAEVFARSYASGGYEIQIDSGKVLMQQGDKLNSFSKGQTVVFKNYKDYSVYESDVQFITPFNFDRYFVEASDAIQVRFAWTAKQMFPYAQIELGEKPYKLEPYFPKPILLSKNEFSIRLPKGVYYWRILFFQSPQKKSLLTTKLQKFTIDPLVRIQPVYPEPNSEFQYVDSGVPIQFQWDNPSDLEKVFIEIAADKNFSKILVHESVNQRNYFSTTLSSEGDYYWRLNGFPFKSSDILTGIARRLRISKKPKNHSIHLVFPMESSLVTQTMVRNSDVVFEWKSDIRALRYRVVIVSREVKRKQQKYEYSVDRNLLKISNLEPGKYTWYVETMNGYKSRNIDFEVLSTTAIKLREKNLELIWDEPLKLNSNFRYRVDVLRVGTDGGLGTFYSNVKSTKQIFINKKNTFDLKKFSNGVYVFKVYKISKENTIVSDSNLLFLKLGE